MNNTSNCCGAEVSNDTRCMDCKEMCAIVRNIPVKVYSEVTPALGYAVQRSGQDIVWEHRGEHSIPYFISWVNT